MLICSFPASFPFYIFPSAASTSHAIIGGTFSGSVCIVTAWTNSSIRVTILSCSWIALLCVFVCLFVCLFRSCKSGRLVVEQNMFVSSANNSNLSSFDPLHTCTRYCVYNTRPCNPCHNSTLPMWGKHGLYGIFNVSLSARPLFSLSARPLFFVEEETISVSRSHTASSKFVWYWNFASTSIFL